LLKTAISSSGQKLWNLFKNKGLVRQEIEMNLDNNGALAPRQS
jgi:hypothetical protein